MGPGLSAKYPVEIEMTSNPRAYYQSQHYMELDLPAAPAVMVGQEVVVEASDMDGMSWNGSSTGNWASLSLSPGNKASWKDPSGGGPREGRWSEG